MLLYPELYAIFCFRLFVLVVVYLVSGILFLKYHKKQEGKDLIPNYEFWKDFPLKIKVCASFESYSISTINFIVLHLKGIINYNF